MGGTRRRALREYARPEQPAKVGDPEDFFKELILSIREDKFIPIVGNTLINERIFNVGAPEADTAGQDGAAIKAAPGAAQDETGESAEEVGEEKVLSITEELADAWAEKIEFPLRHDRYHLERIAQYIMLRSTMTQAKRSYLDFHKDMVLNVMAGIAENSDDEDLKEGVDRLRQHKDKLSFADIATELLPFPENDPLLMLARLPLSIYITTSHYDFMERAIKKTGRTPRTRLCLWNLQDENLDQEDRYDRDYTPTPKDPVVYHLLGLEKYQSSMVLTEDDYLEFLVKLTRSEVQDTGRRLIPPFLEAEVAESSLLLLGYRLQDWDFQVLFRGLIKADESAAKRRRPGVAVQLDPDTQRGMNVKEAESYFDNYFRRANIKVQWGSADNFVAMLQRRWLAANNQG